MDKILRLIFAAGLLLFTGTALWNIGVIAHDDYCDVVSEIVPAQNISTHSMLSKDTMRFPLPRLVLFQFSRLAFHLGLEDPTQQFRVVLGLWALFAFCMFSLFGLKQFQDLKHKRVYLLLLGFYFASPLLLTRAMVESLCAPFLMASCYYAYQYCENRNKKMLVFAVAFMVVSAAFRYQAAAAFPGLIAVVCFTKRYRDLSILAVAGVLGFIAIGFLDLSLTGGFHQTFVKYMQYNIKSSSTHGVTPFYTFVLLFFALTLPPTFVGRYKGFDFKRRYRNLIPAVCYVVSFLVLHSLIPHKEERFMLSVLPLFLMLLTPLCVYWFIEKQSAWRIGYFALLNGVLLLLMVSHTPQNNMVELARYMQRNKEIREVFSWKDSIFQFFTAFVVNSPSTHRVSPSEFKKVKTDCTKALVVRTDYAEEFLSQSSNWREVDSFEPGILEKIVIGLNPSKNLRRSKIHLFRPQKCG